MANCGIEALGTSHLEEAVRFICREIYEFRHEVILPHLALPNYRWLLVDHPRRRTDFIGWGLRTGSGELVGTSLAAWQQYSRGSRTVSSLVSNNSYVAAEYRGARGLSLIQEGMAPRDDADLASCTTANVNSGKVWKAMRAVKLPGAEGEYLLPLNYGVVAMGAIMQKLRPGFLQNAVFAASRIIPPVRRRASRTPITVEALSSAEIPGIDAPPVTNCWEPRRDAEWLHWRYVQHPEQNTKVLRLSRSHGADLFISTFARPRGHKGSVKTVYVMDVWGHAPGFDPAETLFALMNYFRKQSDLLCVRLLAAMFWRETLDKFARFRQLEFPTHWALSRKMCITAEEWRPSHADGDGCF